MPKLPQVKPRDVEKVLLKMGFISSTTKSSHVVFRHIDGRKTVVLFHSKNISTGTLRAILRQSKITVETFIKLIKQ